MNENRGFSKERRPLIKSKKSKSALPNKYNLIGRAPHFLASNSAALINRFKKNSGFTLSTLELDNTDPHEPTVIRGGYSLI